MGRPQLPLSGRNQQRGFAERDEVTILPKSTLFRKAENESLNFPKYATQTIKEIHCCFKIGEIYHGGRIGNKWGNNRTVFHHILFHHQMGSIFIFTSKI